MRAAARSLKNNQPILQFKKQEYSLFDLLSLDNPLALLAVDRLLLLSQTPKRVDARHKTADQPSKPGPVGMLLQFLSGLELAESEGVDQRDGVEGQITGIAKLAANRKVLEHRIAANARSLVVKSHSRGLEVLNELPRTENLAREGKVFLQGIPRRNRRLGLVRAEEVP